MMHQYENIYLKKLTNAIRVLIYEIFKEYFDEKIFKKKKNTVIAFYIYFLLKLYQKFHKNTN